MVLRAHRKIPRLKGQDCWFLLSLLIMFSLLHHNMWMVKMLPGEGFYAKKCWKLRDKSKDCYETCLVLALWLNEANRIFKFLPALCFCIPLNDKEIWVSYNHHVGDPELVNMTETEDRDISSSWGKVRGIISINSSFGTSITEAMLCSLTKLSLMSLSQVTSGSRKVFLLLIQVYGNYFLYLVNTSTVTYFLAEYKNSFIYTVFTIGQKLTSLGA